jgi:hypothetical protein
MLPTRQFTHHLIVLNLVDVTPEVIEEATATSQVLEDYTMTSPHPNVSIV